MNAAPLGVSTAAVSIATQPLRTAAVVFPNWVSIVGTAGQPAGAVIRAEEAAQREFEHVVRRVTDMAPLVHVHAPGVALLSSRGPSRYFGGDEAMARHLYDISRHHLAKTQPLRHGVGVADGRCTALVAAHVSAHRREPVVVPVGGSQRFLASAPVSVLETCADISADTVHLLVRLGMKTCGAVADIEERLLVDRFGDEGRRIFHLVHGVDVEHLVPQVPPSDFSRRWASDEPLSTVSMVLGHVQHDCAGIINAMANRGVQCTRMHIAVESDHGEDNRRVWHQPRGFTVAGLLDRLRWQLSGWGAQAHAATPTAGIVSVRFEPLEVRVAACTQEELWGGSRERDERASRAVTMALSLHPQVAATVVEWAGGRSGATQFDDIDARVIDLTDSIAARQRVSEGQGAARQWSGALPRPLPVTVFASGLKVQLLDQEQCSVFVTGRHELSASPMFVAIDAPHLATAQTLKPGVFAVTSWVGPWPVEERWWDPRRRRRLARLQVIIDVEPSTRTDLICGDPERNESERNEMVLLLCAEKREWSLVALYE